MHIYPMNIYFRNIVYLFVDIDRNKYILMFSLFLCLHYSSVVHKKTLCSVVVYNARVNQII